MKKVITFIGRAVFATLATCAIILLHHQRYQEVTDLRELDMLTESTVSRIPRGHVDSTESGQSDALRDIEANDMKFGVYGLLVGSIDEAYAKYGVTPIWLGCNVAGNGSSYWEGYNQAISAEMKRRYIEVPKVFLTGSF